MCTTALLNMVQFCFNLPRLYFPFPLMAKYSVTNFNLCLSSAVEFCAESIVVHWAHCCWVDYIWLFFWKKIPGYMNSTAVWISVNCPLKIMFFSLSVHKPSVFHNNHLGKSQDWIELNNPLLSHEGKFSFTVQPIQQVQVTEGQMQPLVESLLVF